MWHLLAASSLSEADRLGVVGDDSALADCTLLFRDVIRSDILDANLEVFTGFSISTVRGKVVFTHPMPSPCCESTMAFAPCLLILLSFIVSASLKFFPLCRFGSSSPSNLPFGDKSFPFDFSTHGLLDLIW
jgi:hypothetical protein